MSDVGKVIASLRPDATEVVAEFTVMGEPVSKARARFTNYGSKTRTYTPEKTLNAEQAVAWAFRAAGGRFNDDKGVSFGVIATFHSGTYQRRDVDNMLKLILDGLNGIAWVDDTQVTEIVGRKARAGSKAEARTEVVIYRAGRADYPTRPCIKCGKPFRTFDSLPDTKHCSRECLGRAQLEKRTVALENARRKARERRTKVFPGTCRICGTGTTKKQYLRCNPCKLAGKKVPE